MEAPKTTQSREKLLPSSTLIGSVSLTVAHLDREAEFFQQTLGFRLHWMKEGRAGLGAGGADLVQLVETPGARRAPRTTGLYHFAVLLPDRRELARALRGCSSASTRTIRPTT